MERHLGRIDRRITPDTAHAVKAARKAKRPALRVGIGLLSLLTAGCDLADLVQPPFQEGDEVIANQEVLCLPNPAPEDAGRIRAPGGQRPKVKTVIERKYRVGEEPLWGSVQNGYVIVDGPMQFPVPEFAPAEYQDPDLYISDWECWADLDAFTLAPAQP